MDSIIRHLASVGFLAWTIAETKGLSLQPMSYHILLTIDVEDWFQVENFKQWIPFSSWSSHNLRVEKNTHRILDVLDSSRRGSSLVQDKRLESSTLDLASSNQVKATFFVLGWIAKRLPHLVREICRRGHEVASHGYYHALCKEETPEKLKKDLTDTKDLLEDILGAPVFGYRAPSFSISDDILKIIADCGYLYDSSYNSFAMHGRYGHIDLSLNGKRGIALQIPRTQDQVSNAQYPVSGILYELPISNMKLRDLILPWGGGAYFRFLPFSLFKMGVRSVLKKQEAYLFYIHPWELDPQQPRVDAAPMFCQFRHYTNLGKTVSKLSSFIEAFRDCTFATCYDYLRLR
ncbi:MAG: DUF3473 domain-containing protein [Thermodesulfobacteriota bacterium]|nr:DUF3473 domain-containing protein [Thermodesulfobacteriota bacterium]